jgi:hypothetical protein
MITSILSIRRLFVTTLDFFVNTYFIAFTTKLYLSSFEITKNFVEEYHKLKKNLSVTVQHCSIPSRPKTWKDAWKESLLTLTKVSIGLCAIDSKSVLHLLFVNVSDSISEMRIKDAASSNI